MPYKFKFYIGNDMNFQCNIESQQCIADNKNGGRCSRRVCIGSKYCWTHLLFLKHLRIKNSNLPHGGKGLFAMNPQLEDNNIIFRPGDIIIDYGGEIMSDADLHDRYDDNTAPYAARLKRNVVCDAACERSAGSLANSGNNANQNNAILRANYRTNPQKIQLKASRIIRNNTEILLDYGDEYRFDDDTHHTTTVVR